MTLGISKDRICIVFADLLGVLNIVVKKEGFRAKMRNVVELGHDVMPMVGTSISVSLINLWSKVAQDKNGRLLGADEERADQKLEVLDFILVPERKSDDRNFNKTNKQHIRRIIRVELYNDKVCNVRDVMSATIAEVVGVGTAHSTVGEFCSGMGKDGVPPVKEPGGIAF